ncbi:hypothetical protein ACRW4E_09540, partial [Escherichia coli]
SELLLCHGMVCVVGRMRDLILQLSKSSIYSTKPYRHCIRSFRSEINETVARRMEEDRAAVYAYHLKTQKLGE